MGWASEDFETIDLGDKRLNKCRLPDCEHPQGLSGLETQAAYRLVENLKEASELIDCYRTR